MIQRYGDDIEKVIGGHPTVLSSTLQKQIGPDSKTIYLKGSIAFIDLSILDISVFAATVLKGPSLTGLPYFKVRDLLEIRIVVGNIREMVPPHYSERDCIVCEQTIFTFEAGMPCAPF